MESPGMISWKGSGVGSYVRALTHGGHVRRSLPSAHLAGRAAKSFLDQPLAERPQGPGRVFALGFRRGHAAAAAVEVHPSQTLQFWSGSTEDCGGGSLLLESKEQRPRNVIFLRKEVMGRFSSNWERARVSPCLVQMHLDLSTAEGTELKARDC